MGSIAIRPPKISGFEKRREEMKFRGIKGCLTRRVFGNKTAPPLNTTSAMAHRSQGSLGASPKWPFRAAW